MEPIKEDLDNPGILVRIFGSSDFEVLWLDGHEIIEMANTEKHLSGEFVSHVLSKKGNDNSNIRNIYTPWGECKGTITVQFSTLYESVNFLGRRAGFCVFLRPKAQAIRLLEMLNKSKDSTEQLIAIDLERQIGRFDEIRSNKK